VGTAPPEFWSPFEPALIEPHSTDAQGNQSDHVIDSWIFLERHSYATITNVTSSRSTTWDVAAGATNWYINPGVETTNVNDFSTGTGNTKAYSTLFAQTGVGSAEITLGATADSNTIYSNSLSATGTGTYEASAWIYIPTTAPAYTPRYYRMSLESGNGSVVSNPATKAVPGQWTRISAIVNLTATGATTLVIRTAGSDGSATVVTHDTTAKVYFDNFYIGPSRRTITTTRATTWDVAGPAVSVSVSRSTTWDVKAAVSLARSTTWDTKQQVAPTRSTTWDTKAQVSLTRSTTWNVTTPVAAVSRSTTWNTLSAVAASTRSTTWDVASALLNVAVARSTTWDTKATITPTRSTTWNTLHAVSPTNRTNLVANPSFETDTAGWILNGAGTTIARVTSDSLFGSASLEVTKAAIATAGARLVSGGLIPVTAGDVLIASAYVKVPAGNENTNVRVIIGWLDSPGTTQVGTNTNGTPQVVTSSSGWVRLTAGPATAPAGAFNARVFVVTVAAETAGQKFLVDGVLVERDTTVYRYFDTTLAGTFRSTTWNVLTAVAASVRSTTWDVKKAITGLRSTTWDVASSLASIVTSRLTTWNTKKTVQAAKSTTWDIDILHYRITPQKVEEFYTDNILMGRYGIDTALTVVVKGGVVSFLQSPLDVELSDADWYVLGGHVQDLTPSQVADLTAAGYGSLVEIT